jgi:SM-20-related protein
MLRRSVILRRSRHPAGAETAMTYLDLDAFDRTPLERDPYDHIVVERFIRPDAFAAVSADFPKVPGPGSHPPSELDIHGAFKGLMDELLSDDFRRALETKFDLSLEGRPTMYTVRGFVREKDGQIHTDTKTKIITLLLYMNEGWESDGGRLRILRSGTDLENFKAEVPPYGGTLLIFRRSETSWHGHKTHSGPRRAIQLNWVTSPEVVEQEQSRHRLSTRLKKIKQAVFG